MSITTPLINLLKTDLTRFADQSLAMACGRVFDATTADATKGFIAYHAGIKDALICLENALNWLTSNPSSPEELPATFAPAAPVNPVQGSTPVDDTVIINADDSVSSVN